MMNTGRKPPLLIVCGPTASGKTSLALEVAAGGDYEIISADSRQVYRGMDIGTAKATRAEKEAAVHHLIDVVDPDETFTAADFTKCSTDLIRDIFARGKKPMIVGGTGLYIKALTEGLIDAPTADEALRAKLHKQEEVEGSGTLYTRLSKIDPEMAAKLPSKDLIRIVRAIEVYELSGRTLSDWQNEHAFADRPYRTLKIALSFDRETLYRRINVRVEAMIDEGLIEEVKVLLDKGYSPSLKSMKAIGYREIIKYLEGKISLDEAIEDIQRESRRYAKRQLTWFRKDKSIIWVDSLAESGKLLEMIGDFYDEFKEE